jgi:hypothetical protein
MKLLDMIKTDALEHCYIDICTGGVSRDMVHKMSDKFTFFVKIIMDNDDSIYFDYLSKILLMVFIGFYIPYAMFLVKPLGESDDYMLASISIINHFSLNITDEDVEDLKVYLPEIHHEVQNKIINNFGYPIGLDGNPYPFYMATYSASAIPLILLCLTLKIDAIKGFAILNVLSYALALNIVRKKLKSSRKNVFLALFLLAFSVIPFAYSFWPSAEVFIGSLLIISTVFFINDNHYISAIFCSLASTLNISINGMLFFIILDFLIKHFNCFDKKQNYFKGFKLNLRYILILGMCCVPALLTPIYNILIFGKFTPQSNMASLDGLLGRFTSYWFDLNYGILPYANLIILLLAVIIFKAFFQLNRKVINIMLGCTLMMFLYSFMSHINCGMTLPARYVSWTLPIIYLVVTTLYENLIIHKRLYVCILILSRLIMITIIILPILFSAKDKSSLSKNVSYVYFSPFAQFILNHAPSIYNPLPSTFNSRVSHVDGGYINELKEYIAYYDSRKNYRNEPRKILVFGSTDSIKSVLEDFNINRDHELYHYISTIKNDSKFHYINIPHEP